MTPGAVPRLAGRYVLGELLRRSRGAMVWAAVDIRSGDRVVAVAQPARRAETFLPLIRVRHAHLTSVLDVRMDVPPETLPLRFAVPFGVIILEHVEGETLKDRLRQGPMRPTDAVQVFAKVASALAAMHEAGVHHGGVSSEAVILEPKPAADGPVLRLGAPSNGAFCSPERASGGGPGVQDDVWALHAALFAALTGAKPYRGGTLQEVRASIQAGELRDMAQYGVDDPTLRSLVQRGLVLDAADRRCDARDVERALSRWMRRQAGMVSLPDHVGRGRRSALSLGAILLDSRGALGANASEDGTTGGQGPAQRREARPPRSAWRKRRDPVRGGSRRSGLRPALRAANRLRRTSDGTSGEQDAFVEPAQIPDGETPAASTPAKVESGTFAAAISPASPERTPRRPARPAWGIRHAVALSLASFVVVLSGALVVLWAAGLLPVTARAESAARSDEPAPPATVAAKAGAAPAAPEPQPARGRAPRPAPIAPSATAPAKPDSATPPNASEAPADEQDLQACVASFFGAGSFVEGHTVDLAFLCEDRDFRGVSSLLERVLVSHGAGKVTPAMIVWSNLGWYQMAAAASIRGRCCPDGTAPVTLPASAAPCDKLDETLQQIAATSLDGAGAGALADRYSQCIYCFYMNGIPRPYHYRKPPGPSAREQFVLFLHHAKRRGGAMGP